MYRQIKIWFIYIYLYILIPLKKWNLFHPSCSTFSWVLELSVDWYSENPTHRPYYIKKPNTSKSPQHNNTEIIFNK